MRGISMITDVCAHVLVAEDDPRQAEVLRRYLEAEGHHATLAPDGVTALNLIRRQPPDLVILDVMMPGMDGLDACRLLRRESDVPVLMLTARVGEDNLLEGLDQGADDYVTKPYSPRELMARVRTLLRRNRPGHGPEPEGLLAVGPLTVDPQRRLVALRGDPVDCTPGEFAILSALARRPGLVLSRGQLLEHTRGLDRNSTERTIDVHVMNLRRKLEEDSRRPRLLLTVYGVGYKLAGGPA